MKVEWLNEERMRALVTKGWFRRRQAEVYQSGRGAFWYFALNKERVPLLLDTALDRQQRREEKVQVWQPVARLPKARALPSRTP